MNKPIYDAVVEKLNERKGGWKRICADLDMSYSTLAKIAQGHHANPSVHVVQRLYDYLRRSK
jgi:transcriptional regulator with XRE-family HTH domain